MKVRLTASADLQSRILHFLALFLFFTAYYYTAQWGLKADPEHTFGRLVWAPSGIALAGILLLGNRIWPAIALGQFAASLSLGVSSSVAVGVSIAATAEAFIAATFLRRVQFRPALERVHDVLMLPVGIIFLAAPAGALLASLSLLATKLITRGEFEDVIFSRWLGDSIGAIIVAPLILVWSTPLEILPSWRKRAEAILIAVAVLIFSVFTMTNWVMPNSGLFPRPYLVFPVLTFVAFRLGQRGLSFLSFGISLIAVWATLTSNGRFAGESLNERLLLLMPFLAVLAVSKMTIAAVLSERRTEQEAVKDSDLQRAAILNASLDSIITVDHDDHVIEFNPAAEKLFGYKKTDVLGMEMGKLILPQRFRTAHKARMKNFLKTSGDAIFEERHELFGLRADGTEVPLEMSIVPLKSPGKPKFSAFIKDLTEKRLQESAKLETQESEKFLAGLTELLSESIDYRTTLRRTANALAPRFADWSLVMAFGSEGGSPVLEATSSDSESAEAFEGLVSSFLNRLTGPTLTAGVIHSKKSRLVSEFSDEIMQSVAADADHLALLRQLKIRSAIVCPILFHGQLLGVLVAGLNDKRPNKFGPRDLSFFEEISRRAASAIENSRLYQEAQEALYARDEFLSVASHELRTPVTSLSLQLQHFNRILQKSYGPVELSDPEAQITIPAKMAKGIGACETQTKKLAGLLDELLDLTRIRLGKLQLDREPVELGNVVKEVIARFKAESNQKGVVISTDLDSQAVGIWDRMRVDQIVTNLLSNALKYGQAKPIHIQVKNFPTFARLTVQDQGMGVAPEMRDRLFERFERAGISGQKIAGLGLGLYICRQIVEAHGGKIELESVLGKGSTFTVELPLKLEHEVDVPPNLSV